MTERAIPSDTDDPDHDSTSDTTSRRNVVRSIGGVLALGAAGATASRASAATDAPDDPKYTNQYVPRMIRAPGAWADQRADDPKVAWGTSHVTVGILDTGVDYTHPDLERAFGADEGYDFVDDDDDPKQDPARWYVDGATLEVHGTHVAGIIGATKDNETEISGIAAPHLLSARVAAGIDQTSEDGAVMGGEIDQQTALEGAKYLIDSGADVINVSMAASERTSEVTELIDYAFKRDVVVVAAAGNDHEDEVGYPARFPDAIGVSAVGTPSGVELDETVATDDVWDRDPATWDVDLWEGNDAGSNYGRGVDVCAPGEKVLSLYPDRWFHDRYGRGGGTSMATAVVTGVAALIRGKNPGLSAHEVMETIRYSARGLGLPETKQGAGLVDAAAAVDRVENPRRP